MAQKQIEIRFMTEKTEGHGEDAPPVLICKKNAFATGVFDGMGGSGANLCHSKYGENYTMAYVASRIIRDTIELFLDQKLDNKEEFSKEDIKQIIKNRLNEEKKEFSLTTTSILRSKLIRTYPTTMAVATLRMKKAGWCVDAFWAGDSRCYLWTKKGFFQITKDDLEEDNDPMKNLRNDSSMSNCICLDNDFHINHNQIQLSAEDEPIMILSATDGCFGYYSTPMEFESILKKSLNKAKNEEEWKTNIQNDIQKVTGDDTSFALIGIGYESFNKFKSIFTKQRKDYNKIKNYKEEAENKEKEYQKARKKYEDYVLSCWNTYQSEYMKYIN